MDAQPEVCQNAEGSIVLPVFRAVLAGSEGVAVPCCINLKEKLCS